MLHRNPPLLYLTLFSLLATLGLSAAAQAQSEELSAEEIVERSLDTNTIGFQTGEVVMSLVIEEPGRSSRTRTMQVRGASDDGRTRAIVRVIEPAEMAGQSYLFRENPQGEDDVFVFLPALDDAPRRIAGSQKDSSFMGSHFTFSDLESRDIRDSEYERLPDESIAQFPVYVIDARPEADADSDYSRVRMWIRQSDYIPLRVRFYDNAGQLSRTIFTEQIAESDSGRTYVSRLALRLESGESTTMVIREANFEAEISASEFTPDSLTQ